MSSLRLLAKFSDAGLDFGSKAAVPMPMPVIPATYGRVP